MIYLGFHHRKVQARLEPRLLQFATVGPFGRSHFPAVPDGQFIAEFLHLLPHVVHLQGGFGGAPRLRLENVQILILEGVFPVEW